MATGTFTYNAAFKLDKSNAVSVGTTAIKPYLSICLVGLVWFARYCGKMYSRHLFSYGGLTFESRGYSITGIQLQKVVIGYARDRAPIT